MKRLLPILLILSGPSFVHAQSAAKTPPPVAPPQQPLESAPPAKPLPTEFLNLRFSPTEVLFGGIGLGLDVKVAEHVSLGFKYSSLSFRLFDTTWKGSTTTIRGDYSFKPMFVSSFYLTGQTGQTSLKISLKDVDGQEYSVSGSGIFFGVGGGYHWFWKSFNLNIGGVLASNPIGKLKVTNNAGTEIESENAPITTSAIDFGLGFTF